MRRFGVELEHGNRRHSVESIATAMTRAGIPCFVGGQHGQQAFGREDWFSVSHDGSGLEVRTPPLPGTREGFRRLQKAMGFLKRAGGYVTCSDGMHVHFEALDYHASREAKQKLEVTWINNANIIRQIVDPHRRNNQWCHRLPHVGADGRYDLNTVGRRNQTIEIRLHEGTLEYRRAAQWLRLGNQLLDRCYQLDAPIDPCQNLAEFLTHLKAPTRVKQYCLNWQPQPELAPRPAVARAARRPRPVFQAIAPEDNVWNPGF